MGVNAYTWVSPVVDKDGWQAFVCVGPVQTTVQDYGASMPAGYDEIRIDQVTITTVEDGVAYTPYASGTVYATTGTPTILLGETVVNTRLATHSTNNTTWYPRVVLPGQMPSTANDGTPVTTQVGVYLSANGGSLNPIVLGACRRRDTTTTQVPLSMAAPVRVPTYPARRLWQ